MKTPREGFRMLQREQRMYESEDSYRESEKPPEPARCPECRAVFQDGRWSWGKAPAKAIEHRCPACRRIDDDLPAGYVTLRGPFFGAHRDEVIAVVHSREERARLEHPLQRIMQVTPFGDGVRVTTTDPHLARRIGEAVHRAFKGDLSFSWSKSENLLRATWKR